MAVTGVHAFGMLKPMLGKRGGCARTMASRRERAATMVASPPITALTTGMGSWMRRGGGGSAERHSNSLRCWAMRERIHSVAVLAAILSMPAAVAHSKSALG